MSIISDYVPPNDDPVAPGPGAGWCFHAAADRSPIKIICRGYNLLLLPLDCEFHLPWREFHH